MSKKLAWNSGKVVGPKPPLTRDQLWGIRVRLELSGNKRELALFNLAIDSKLRASDLVRIKVNDIVSGQEVADRATVRQKKTGDPVKFEITQGTREALADWISYAGLGINDYVFQSRFHNRDFINERQYARIAKKWFKSVGIDPNAYGTHSLRRTKVTLFYRETKDMRQAQLLLGHKNINTTIGYLGVDREDALEASERISA